MGESKNNAKEMHHCVKRKNINFNKPQNYMKYNMFLGLRIKNDSKINLLWSGA